MEYKQIWRFYTERSSEGVTSQPTIELPEDEAHFAFSVLRLSVGEHVELADGCGWVAQAKIIRADKKSVCAQVESSQDVPQSRCRLVAVVGITKSGALDEVVQACVEAGVSDLILFKGDRSTSKQEVKTDKISKQIRELSRITKSPWVMRIYCKENLLATFKEVYQIAQPEKILICDERPAHMRTETSRTHHLMTEAKKFILSDVAFIVGPESSFSAKEYEIFDVEEKSNRACFVTLGPRILRTPAAVAAAAYQLSGLCESHSQSAELGI